MIPFLAVAIGELGGVLKPGGVHGSHVVLRKPLDLPKELS